MQLSYYSSKQTKCVVDTTTKQGDVLLIQSSLDVGKARKLKRIHPQLLFKPIFSKGWEKSFRHCIEHGYVDYITGLEQMPWQDKTQTRSIAFNHVYAKLCNKHGIEVVFESTVGKNTHRILQIIKICKKYGVKYSFHSFAKNKFELRSDSDVEALSRLLSRPKWPFLNKKYINQVA